MEIALFIVFFGLTLVIERWLQQHIQGFAFAVTGDPGCAVRVLFLLLLPGVLLHEFSHWLIANLTGVRTGAVSIGLGKTRGKHFSLGSVTVERTDPLREALIGIAPFIFGIVAVWAIMGYGFDLWPDRHITPELVGSRIWESITDPLTWLALYLVFAVSTSMIPSESDREPWGVIIVLFGAIGGLAVVFGWTPNASPDIITAARQLLDTLTFVFGIITFVNGTLALVVFLIEWGFGTVTQRKVRY